MPDQIITLCELATVAIRAGSVGTGMAFWTLADDLRCERVTVDRAFLAAVLDSAPLHVPGGLR